MIRQSVDSAPNRISVLNLSRPKTARLGRERGLANSAHFQHRWNRRRHFFLKKPKNLERTANGAEGEMLFSAVAQSPSFFPRPPRPFSFPGKHPSHAYFFFCSTHPETVFPRPFIPSLLSKSTSEPIQFTPPSSPEDGLEEPKPEPDLESVSGDDGGDGSFEIEVDKLEKKNGRRIRARIRVEADLDTVWSVLTDYEGLADFIPSLAVSQLIEKKDKFARLYQVINFAC